MRLWHIDLIPYLPKKQLVAQWRELNSIFKKQDKHILINYIYDYNRSYLLNYTQVVIRELYNRNCKIKSLENYNKYFSINKSFGIERFVEHNNEYLTTCYWNLREKYIRKQKDFTEDVWLKLDKYYKDTIYNSYPKELKKILSRKDFELLFKGLIKGE